MLTNKPEDLREMCLKPYTDPATVENVMLSNLTRRAEIHTKFMQTNRPQASQIEWGKEKSENNDGL